ncbi:MAG: GxxExxY protein [Candidatus Omnitrophota bacterium]|nr:GxxExxY protein [Candidatus Omnitrophota bacterium]
MTARRVRDFLYGRQSYAIRGACFDVWNTFGGAFKEVVVERALNKAFAKRGLKVDRQKRIAISYEGELVGIYQPDFVIDDRIVVELKCKPVLANGDRRQFWQYLKGSHYRLGFLIHFGSERLEIIRVVYDRAREKSRISVNQR